MRCVQLRSSVVTLLLCAGIGVMAQTSVDELGGASDGGQRVFDGQRKGPTKFDPAHVYTPNEVTLQPVYPGSDEALAAHFAKAKDCMAVIASPCCTSTLVQVSFIVERDGTITSPDAHCESCSHFEALAVCMVHGMARWAPGEIRDVPVRVRITVPVRYEQR